jgi:hypothetical protein
MRIEIRGYGEIGIVRLQPIERASSSSPARAWSLATAMLLVPVIQARPA